MKSVIIIIDNDSLVKLTNLSELGIFRLLRNIFKQVLIPEKVKEEYERKLNIEKKRAFILDRLRPNEGFWALCTRYDTFNNVFLFKYKGIDKGEAEIISQSAKTGNMLVISDDKNFKTACNSLNPNIRIYNSLFVLAALDIHKYLPDSVKFFRQLYCFRNFKNNDLREAYKLASEYYGIKHNPKKVSKKTFDLIKNKCF